MKKSLVIPSFVATVLMTSTALAQTPPSTVMPGRVGSEISKSFDARQKIQTPELPDTPLQVAPEGADKIKLTLKKVVVNGNKTLSDADLSSVYADDLGKTITLTRVYEIANEMTAKYRNNGYLLSRAIVPKQEINSGVVTIRIIEGFVDGYTIQGETRGSNERIRVYADKIINSGTLNSKELERYLLLMNDIPGVTVRAVLSPSETTAGAATMTLIATDKLVDGMVGVDNYGNTYLGAVRLLGQANLNSFFKMGEKTTLTYLTAPDDEELNYFQATYAMPVGYEGTTAGASISYTMTKPSLPSALGGSLGTEGAASMISLFVDHPLIRSRAESLFVGASFDYATDRTNYDPAFASLQTEDRTRVLKLKGSYSLLDEYAGYNAAQVELAQGLSILDSSGKAGENLSRANGDDQFTKVNFDVSRLQSIYGRISGLLGVAGQVASDSLLAGQEFGFGGASYGRGYDISELTGDNGLASKVELIYSQPVNLPDINDYQAYVFYDFGKVWNKNPAVGDDRSESAASIGVGTRVTFSDYISGEAFVAKPLTRPVASRENSDPDDGNDLRFKFSLTGKF